MFRNPKLDGAAAAAALLAFSGCGPAQPSTADIAERESLAALERIEELQARVSELTTRTSEQQASIDNAHEQLRIMSQMHDRARERLDRAENNIDILDRRTQRR